MGPLPFWQLFSLLGLSCVYQLISDCLSQHINSLSPSLLPSPPAHFPSSFFLGARGRLWDGFCWFASGFELVPVYGCLFAVCILYLSLFLLPFLCTFRGVCFGFRLWLTCGVGEAGLTLVDQCFDCICAWFRCFGCFYLCSRLFMCNCTCVCCRYVHFGLPLGLMRSPLCVSVFLRTHGYWFAQWCFPPPFASFFYQAQSCLDIWVGCVLLALCIPWGGFLECVMFRLPSAFSSAWLKSYSHISLLWDLGRFLTLSFIAVLFPWGCFLPRW